MTSQAGLAVSRPKIAVLGCGNWGKNLVRNFAELGALEAIHDPDSGRAATFSAQYDVTALGAEEVLERPEIAGVVIATPTELHASLAIRALEAGKHVLVEKPLALRIRDAEQVMALAEKVGRTLMVGHLLQYHPGFLKLKEVVTEGRLGRLRYIFPTT